MKPIIKTLPSSVSQTVIPIRPQVKSQSTGSLGSLVLQLDNVLLTILRRWSITALRLALGAIFLWFGALKVFGNSPVASMIHETYAFLPIGMFVMVLGIWEVLIGIGIILRRALRCMLVLLSVHLVGTFTAILLNPRLFFVQGFPLCLTVDGEFVMKNLVLMTAALVIAGYQVKPLRRH